MNPDPYLRFGAPILSDGWILSTRDRIGATDKRTLPGAIGEGVAGIGRLRLANAFAFSAVRLLWARW